MEIARIKRKKALSSRGLHSWSMIRPNYSIQSMITPLPFTCCEICFLMSVYINTDVGDSCINILHYGCTEVCFMRLRVVLELTWLTVATGLSYEWGVIFVKWKDVFVSQYVVHTIPPTHPPIPSPPPPQCMFFVFHLPLFPGVRHGVGDFLQEDVVMDIFTFFIALEKGSVRFGSIGVP